MKYSIKVRFIKTESEYIEKEFIFDSYEEVIYYLKHCLTEDNEKYKDFCYLWQYTIKTIKEGGNK